MRRDPVKAVLYGVGTMGKLIVPLLTEKGVIVIGAIGGRNHLGEDLGEVCGLERKLHVTVSDDPEEVLSTRSADVAIVSIATFLADMFEPFERCIRNGLNVLTISEEMHYAWGNEPELTAKLDHLARLHGVTIAGSGYTDHFFFGQVAGLAGCCHRIDRIDGVGQDNLEDYGAGVAAMIHVGETVAAFEAAFPKSDGLRTWLQPVADAICVDLGLTPKTVRTSTTPWVEDVDMPCEVLDLTVKAGDVTGRTSQVDVETIQGTHVHFEFRERLYREGETDLNRWSILGYPDVTIENPAPAIATLTAAALVNRIPDVLDAQPGYRAPHQLSRPRYRPYPLHFYVRGDDS